MIKIYRSNINLSRHMFYLIYVHTFRRMEI